MECYSKIANKQGEYSWDVDDSTIIAVGKSSFGEAVIRTVDGREYTLANTSQYAQVKELIKTRNKQYYKNITNTLTRNTKTHKNESLHSRKN